MRRFPILAVYAAAFYLFIALPLVVVVIVSLNQSEVVTFPPKSWSFRWYRIALANQDFIASFVVSTKVAVLTTVFALLVGISASLALVRYEFPGKKLLRGASLAPLTFPQVVLGLALLEFFVASLRLELTIWTIVVAHVVVTTPFVVQIISSTLFGFDRTVEEAALTLGATPLQALRRITFPLVRPGILTAGLFAFILSLDNVGISIFLASPGLVPLPIRMFQYVETQYDPTIAVISTALIAYAIVIMLLLQRMGTLGQVFRGRR